MTLRGAMLTDILRAIVFLCFCGGAVAGCSLFQGEPEEVIEVEECTEAPLDVHVTIADKRWCREGGYAMPKMSIYLKKDLAGMIRGGVLSALEGINLNEAEGGVEVYMEVEQFFCDVTERRSSWNCVSELMLGVKVFDACGGVVYDRRISGVAENDFEKAEKNGKSRKSLDTSVEEAMQNLLGDKGFRRAIKCVAHEGAIRQAL